MTKLTGERLAELIGYYDIPTTSAMDVETAKALRELLARRAAMLKLIVAAQEYWDTGSRYTGTRDRLEAAIIAAREIDG